MDFIYLINYFLSVKTQPLFSSSSFIWFVNTCCNSWSAPFFTDVQLMVSRTKTWFYSKWYSWKKIRFEVKTFRLTWRNLLETQTEEFIIFQFCYERSKLWIEFITILLEYLNKKHSALHLQQFTTICSK